MSILAPRQWRRHLGPHNGQVPLPPYFVEEAFGDNRQNPRFGVSILRLPGNKHAAMAAMARSIPETGGREVVVAHRLTSKHVILRACVTGSEDVVGCRSGLEGARCRVLNVQRISGEWMVSEEAGEECRRRGQLVDGQFPALDARTERIQTVRSYLSMLATASPEYDPLRSAAAASIVADVSGTHAFPAALLGAVGQQHAGQAA